MKLIKYSMFWDKNLFFLLNILSAVININTALTIIRFNGLNMDSNYL